MSSRSIQVILWCMVAGLAVIVTTAGLATAKQLKESEIHPIVEMQYDGCQYLRHHNYYVLIHKANCTNHNNL